MANTPNLYVRQGGQLQLLVQRGDSDATSATIYMRPHNPGTVITKTATYDSDGFADLTLTAEQTGVIDVYDYQINEIIPGETPIKYPDPVANDNCVFPTIEICESLDE